MCHLLLPSDWIISNPHSSLLANLAVSLTEQEEMLTGRLPGKYSTEDASYVHVRPGETAGTPGQQDQR